MNTPSSDPLDTDANDLPLDDFQYLIWSARRLDFQYLRGNTAAQANVLKGLSGQLDLMDTFPSGMEALGVIGLPIPPLYILNEIHQYTDLPEEDARLILRVLVSTKSTATYLSSISYLLNRFPGLSSEFPQLSEGVQ